RMYRAGYDRAWQAALRTLEDMEMRVVDQTRGETEGKIEAKRFNGAPVRVILKSKALDLTQIRVRIGAVGDRGEGEIFHERLRKNLFD
ncbi:MAG: DUF3568 family protein, partial [Deltaproteobacteria bacterium]|nr:DUF3568 family protein [Deltaproteobacteria bacterium]